MTHFPDSHSIPIPARQVNRYISTDHPVCTLHCQAVAIFALL